MDVRCRQCGTEYELDDARVGSTGTTVKCSTCAHVFKVMPSGDTREASGVQRPAPAGGGERPERTPRTPSTETPTLGTQPAPPRAPVAAAAVPPPSAPQAAGDWMVKKADGQIFRFRELTTLQKWIVERKVVRDDEISRTGKSWKKLGEIAELTSFFQVVEAADAAQRSVSMAQLPQVHLTATATGTFQAYPLPAAPAAPATQAALVPAEPLAPVAPAAPEPPLAHAGDGVDLDDDDPVLAWQRRRRRGGIAASVVLAVVLVVGLVFALTRGDDDMPVAVRAKVQTALSTGDAASRDVAVRALQALPPAKGTAAAAVAAARARLLSEEARGLRDAIHLAEEASATAAAMQAAAPTGIPDPAAVARAEQLLAESGAITMSTRAAGHVIADVDLATATAALAAGDLPALQAATTLAREHAQVDDDATRAAVDDELRLLLSLAEAAQIAPTDVAAAQVVTDKLARFGDARARAATAIAGLVAVRTARLAALAQTPPVAVDGAVVERARAATAAPMTPTTPTTTPTTPTPIPADESFDALMMRGEKALKSERSAAAHEAFKRATQKNPASARAWLNLGWACLDTGKKAEAPRAFEKALSLSPALSEARFGLAEALRFAGRNDEAIAAYQAYLEQDPGGKDAGIAKNALKQLE